MLCDLRKITFRKKILEIFTMHCMHNAWHPPNNEWMWINKIVFSIQTAFFLIIIDQTWKLQQVSASAAYQNHFFTLSCFSIHFSFVGNQLYPPGGESVDEILKYLHKRFVPLPIYTCCTSACIVINVEALFIIQMNENICHSFYSLPDQIKATCN